MCDKKWLDTDTVRNRIAEALRSADPDDALSLYVRWQSLKAAVRQLDDEITTAMIEVIERQSDRQLVLGDRRFYAGHRRDVKCRDKTEAVKLLLELLGPGGLIQCLRAEPLKPATTRHELERAGDADGFDRLFQVTQRGVVKEGAADKQLLVADARFISHDRVQPDTKSDTPTGTQRHGLAE
jgi:hypothetical protein